MDKITLALDWTPNTNHTGFFVARAKGWYAEQDIQLIVHHPEEDGYRLTPARRVAEGLADFGVAPSESVLSYRLLPESVPLLAVAAILQRDASAIVCTDKSAIRRPADFAGKTYASYQARYEDQMVRAMMRNDGADAAALNIIYPHKLGIWDTVLAEKADLTWVFLPWEGVEATHRQVGLRSFCMADYGVPYGYSPVLLAHAGHMAERRAAYRRFMQVTQRGFEYATLYPDQAAVLLQREAAHHSLHDIAFLIESQREAVRYYMADSPHWGLMQAERWAAFIAWLQAEGIVPPADADALAQSAAALPFFSHELLQG